MPLSHRRTFRSAPYRLFYATPCSDLETAFKKPGFERLTLTGTYSDHNGLRNKGFTRVRTGFPVPARARAWEPVKPFRSSRSKRLRRIAADAKQFSIVGSFFRGVAQTFGFVGGFSNEGWPVASKDADTELLVGMCEGLVGKSWHFSGGK